MKKIVACGLLFLLYWCPKVAQAQNRPDLVIMAPFNVPGNVIAGGTYTMSAVIKNQGTNGAQFNCIGFYLSGDNVWDATDAFLGTSCQSLLFPGQSGTCSITASISPLATVGSRYILLIADPLNAEQESDETNNQVSFAVTVAAGGTALPDLALWRPSISFAILPAGGSTGSFTFINNWGTAAAGAYEVGFYLSADTVFSAGTDVYLGLASGSSLPPNGGTIHSAPVLTVPRTTVPGNYYLVLMADPRNVVAESNENNNSRALPLRVTGAMTAVASGASADAAVYPNPVVRGAPLGVTLPGNSRPVEFAFYDAMGRLTARQSGVGVVAQVDTRALPAGIYLLRISFAQQTATRRVVVQ